MKLVLIDDDEQILVILGQYLRFSGFEVQVFSDPVAGLNCCLKRAPKLVVTDVKMDPINGFEIARQLNAQSEPPFVIMMTGFYEREIEAKAAKFGIAKVLEKPVRGDDLVQVARQLLHP